MFESVILFSEWFANTYGLFGVFVISLLESFMERPGVVLSRSQLEERLYGWGAEVESNAVEVHISNLRKKLSPEVIRTIRGVGYILGIKP